MLHFTTWYFFSYFLLVSSYYIHIIFNVYILLHFIALNNMHQYATKYLLSRSHWRNQLDKVFMICRWF